MGSFNFKNALSGGAAGSLILGPSLGLIPGAAMGGSGIGLDSIFKQPDQTQTTNNILSPEQAALLDQAASMAGITAPLFLKELGYDMQIGPDGKKSIMRTSEPGAGISDAATNEFNRVYKGTNINPQDAFNSMAPVDKVYDSSMAGVRDFQLSPAADSYLSYLRNERIGGIKNDINNLVGDTVFDLGKRGVLSSSTAEGALGNVAKAAAPAVSQANADYWNAKISLPQTVGMNTYNMASDYGGKNLNAWNAAVGAGQTKLGNAQTYGSLNANALQNAWNMKVNPLLQFYQTNLGAGTTPRGTTTTQTGGGPSPFQVGVQAAGMALPFMMA